MPCLPSKKVLAPLTAVEPVALALPAALPVALPVTAVLAVKPDVSRKAWCAVFRRDTCLTAKPSCCLPKTVPVLSSPPEEPTVLRSMSLGHNDKEKLVEEVSVPDAVPALASATQASSQELHESQI